VAAGYDTAPNLIGSRSPNRRLTDRATSKGWLIARHSAAFPVTMLPSGRTATTADATTDWSPSGTIEVPAARATAAATDVVPRSIPRL
jgi:hypothetical protein